MPIEVIEDKKIYYSLNFQSPSRKNLLFIHGASSDSRVFLNVVENLSKKFNIVIIDLSGHGQSEGEGYRNVVDHAFICGELLKRLDLGEWSLLGHSLGGAIGMAMGVYMPKLVESLILVSTGARLRVPESFLSAIEKGSNNAQLNKEFLLNSIYDTSNRHLLDYLLTIMNDVDPVVVYKDWLAADSFDFTRRLKGLDFRALILCGDKDLLTPVKYHEFLNDEISSSQLAVISDCGHWPFVEKEPQFTEKINNFFSNF